MKGYRKEKVHRRLDKDNSVKSVNSVLNDLRRRGVVLQAVHDPSTGCQRLRAGPRAALTSTVANILASHRDAVLAALAACAVHNDPGVYVDEPDPRRDNYVRTTCKRCGRFLGYRRRESP